MLKRSDLQPSLAPRRLVRVIDDKEKQLKTSAKASKKLGKNAVSSVKSIGKKSTNVKYAKKSALFDSDSEEESDSDDIYSGKGSMPLIGFIWLGLLWN